MYSAVLVVVVLVVEEQEPEEPRRDKRLEHWDCRLDWKVEQGQLLGDFRDRHNLNNS